VLSTHATVSLAVIGAGPVGLSLALHVAQALPAARVTLFDARAAAHDVSGDPRTLALSLGSVQLLQRLDAWNGDAAERIVEVHVSQQPPSLPALLGAWLPEPQVRIRALDEAVPMLGAVMSYGAIVVPLQRAWSEAVQRERCASPAASARRSRR
jgi:2-octaprenyl-6-methoxyphenol hydroxylase